MNVKIRLTNDLYERVRKDLLRPHWFAAERVGFIYGSLANAGTVDPLVLLTDYETLDDDRYVNDPHAGARIDGTAIRGAMQNVLDRKKGVFHVHMHDFPGYPFFSWMDREELPRLIPSFQAVGPAYAHGLFLLSPDACAGEVWMPGESDPIIPSMISIVGFPMRFT